MTRRIQVFAFSAMAVFVPGCGVLGDLFGQSTSVTVRLVNNADFTVDVDLFISSEQDIPREVLTTLGDHLEFTLAPGESTSFMRDCDDLQAVVIDDADLVGSLGPHADSNVLRDDADFDCGDTIVFTFDHSATVTDFHINVEVIPGPP